MSQQTVTVPDGHVLVAFTLPQEDANYSTIAILNSYPHEFNQTIENPDFDPESEINEDNTPTLRVWPNTVEGRTAFVKSKVIDFVQDHCNAEDARRRDSAGREVVNDSSISVDSNPQ